MSFPDGSSVCADTVKPNKKRSRGGQNKAGVPEEAPKDAEPIKTRKIRMRLTKLQRKMLTEWMGSARFTYNKCLEAVTKKGAKMNHILLRQQFVSETLMKREGKMASDKFEGERNFEVGAFVKANDWLKKTPYDIRDNAVRDLLKANESNRAKHEKNPKHKWKLHFKKRSKPTGWTIALHAKAIRNVKILHRPETRRPRKDHRSYDGCARRKWTQLDIYPNSKLGKFWLTEAVPNGEITKDCRITRDFTGHFYLCVPFDVDPHKQTVPEAERKVVALDPGVRAFQTYYSPESTGAYGEGEGGFDKIIQPLCDELDDTLSQ